MNIQHIFYYKTCFIKYICQLIDVKKITQRSVSRLNTNEL